MPYKSTYFEDLHVYTHAGKWVVALNQEQAVKMLGAEAVQVPDEQTIDLVRGENERHYPKGYQIVGSCVRATAKAWADFEGVPGFLAHRITREDLLRFADNWQATDPQFAQSLRKIAAKK